jgi:hypothetical protein
MQGKSYRLNTPTLAIIVCDGQKVAATIPSGGTVTVSGGDIDGNRLIDVIWDGKEAMIFTQDLRDRGELVIGEKA